MPEILRVSATGANGATYQFEMYPMGTRFAKLPGIYVFATPPIGGQWDVVYIGQTHDLDQRVGSGLHHHHKHSLACRRGAQYVGVMAVQGPEAVRLRIERDLCQAYNPCCNDVSDPLNALFGGA